MSASLAISLDAMGGDNAPEMVVRGGTNILIAVVILKEPLRPARIVAALMIVCGLMLLRVA